MRVRYSCIASKCLRRHAVTFSNNLINIFLKAEDIDLMIERMEEQVRTLLQAYREELTQIEVCFTNIFAYIYSLDVNDTMT